MGKNLSLIQLPVKAEPYEHQREAFLFACGKYGFIPSIESEAFSPGVALMMEVGCGKTLTSIAIVGEMYRRFLIHRLLVVCPLSVMGVWDEEFKKFADFPYSMKLLIGSSSKKSCALKEIQGDGLQAAVINYESMWRLEKEISKWKPDMIIADEGHKIKTPGAAVSKAMHRLGVKTNYKLLLTGTLITNKELDVFSQYKFLNSDIYGKSFYLFRNRYFDMTGYGQYTPVLKESMKQELTEKLHSIAYRVTKKECLDLPDTVNIVRYVNLEPEAFKTYLEIAKDSFAELSDGEVMAANVLTKCLRLSQVTGGFLKADEKELYSQISSAKPNALSDIIDDVLESGKKLVVIARFIPEINAICKMLENKNILYSLVKGGVSDRTSQIEKFQTDPETKVFVGQIAAAGLGITLTAASTMVFYSLDHSVSNFEQAKARIHRVGQTQKCTYFYLTAKGTVDETTLESLKNMKAVARELIDEFRKGKNPFILKGDDLIE